jgi:Domain of unknown function (DUF4160)
MPTVLRIGPYRFFFYSGDGTEPPHIHVERDDRIAKFWLNPVRLTRSGGFNRGELSEVESHVIANAPMLQEAWNEYFGA